MQARRITLPAITLLAIIFSIAADTLLFQPAQAPSGQPPDFVVLSLIKNMAAVAQAVLMLWLARVALFEKSLTTGAYIALTLVGLILMLLCTILVYRALPFAFLGRVVLDSWSNMAAAPVSLALLIGAMLSAIGGAGLLFRRR